MSRASELFSAVPRRHNCAQAVACGCGREDLYQPLAQCGGGRAPGGCCGALHAAMLAAGETAAGEIRREFIQELGAEHCSRLKKELAVPCARCVETAERLLRRYCSPTQ